jgi:hypothetical protein
MEGKSIRGASSDSFSKDHELDSEEHGNASDGGAAMKWIKCEDQLPEFNKQILCFDPSHSESKIYVVKLEKEDFYQVDKCKLGNPQQWIEAAGESYFTWEPTHWMPLPNAPETDGGE